MQVVLNALFFICRLLRGIACIGGEGKCISNPLGMQLVPRMDRESECNEGRTTFWCIAVII